MKNIKVYPNNLDKLNKKYNFSKKLVLVHNVFTYFMFPVGVGLLIYNSPSYSNDIIFSLETTLLLIGFRYCYHIKRIILKESTFMSDYQESLLKQIDSIKEKNMVRKI